MAPGPWGSYEFNAYENAIVDRTARRAKLWGMISVVLGVLQVFGSCGMAAEASLAVCLPTGIVATVVGITFIGVGNSLRAVVTTEGNDVPHLMQALAKMNTAFIIQIVCTVLGFIVTLAAVVLITFVFVARAAAR